MSSSNELKLSEVLQEAWTKGFSLQSAFARKHSGHVAMAASMQLITTKQDKDVFSHKWQITGKGLRYLNELKEHK